MKTRFPEEKRKLKKKVLFALHKVTFGFPNQKPLFNDLSFAIKFGESVAILLDEGAGRTSIFKLMEGLLQPDQGNAYINEFPVAKLPQKILQDYRAQIGFLFCRENLISNLTIFDNVALPFRYHSALPEEYVAPRVEAILDQFGLSPYKMHRPAFVSMYVRSLTAIARSFLMAPPAFLVDNVFEGLGRRHATKLVKVIKEVMLLSEGTFVYTSNDPEFISQLAKRVIFIQDGRVYFDGPFTDFFNSQDLVIKRYLKEHDAFQLTRPDLDDDESDNTREAS